MVKLRKIEASAYYPKKASDLLHTSSIPGWVELDLSGFSRDKLSGTGLKNVKNSGVFIHPDDIPLLEKDSINFPIILSHSYGLSKDNSLTYRPKELSTRELVSVPEEIIKSAIKNTRYLSEIDKLAGLNFKRDLTIYTTGSNGIKGLQVPNSYYNIAEGRVKASETDFTCFYKSLYDLGKQTFIEKKEKSNLDLESCFNLLTKILPYNPKIRREIDLRTDIINKFIKSLDKSLLGENITEDSLKADLDTIKELDSSIFKSNPHIPVYTYNLYFTKYTQINIFLNLLGKDKKFTNSIDKPQNINRNSSGNIYIFRPGLSKESDENKRKHILSIITQPQGQFKLGRAIDHWNDSLNFNSNGHLDSVQNSE